MADNDQLLKQLGNLIDQKLEPVEKDMQDVKQDIQGVKQTQGEQKTMVEAVLAGQQELQETVATRADMLDVKASLTRKVNDHEERITELEKERNIPHPHKH